MKYVYPALLSPLLMLGCKKAAPDTTVYDQSPVIRIEAPATGMVNESLPVQVYFHVYMNSGEFGRFEETITDDTRVIQVKAAYPGRGCFDQPPLERSAIYYFTASRPGTYYLKFAGEGSGFVRKTIDIR